MSLYHGEPAERRAAARAYFADLDSRALAPLVPARAARPDEVCAGARGLASAAEGAGWVVALTYACGYTTDAHGDPEQGFRWEPVTGEDGRIVLTPTGRPSRRKALTGEPLVVESLAVRAARGGDRLVAVWNRAPGERWAFALAQAAPPWRSLTSPQARALVADSQS